MNMRTYDIRKLERTLEEHGVDLDTRTAIVEASIHHNHVQLPQKFEDTLKKIPVASLKTSQLSQS